MSREDGGVHVEILEREHTDTNPKTCDSRYEIYNSNGPTNSHISKCRDRCNNNPKCGYFLYKTDTSCILFNCCENTRETTGDGVKITYKNSEDLFFKNVENRESRRNRVFECFSAFL